MIAQGGKSIYGAPIGILMLEARFPRIPGDMGNAKTWPFPVRYKTVRGATPDLVVRHGAEGLLDAFISAGRELVEDGCEGITTNCGFLSLFQREMADALDVPVATSSLMQAGMIAAILPAQKRVGILTISAETLTEQHLVSANAPKDTPVIGVKKGCELQSVILENRLELDVKQARQDMIEAAKRFPVERPEVGAILLECTNMPPFAEDVRAASELPVFSIVDFITWFHHSLDPVSFA